MLTLVLFVLFVVLVVLLVKTGEEDFYVGVSGFTLLFLIVAIVVKIGCCYSCYMSIPVHYERLEADKKVYAERRDDYEVIVRAELDKYPAYESQIFASLDSEIILKYPELKSNETIVTAFKSLIEFNEELYDIDLEVNRLRGAQAIQRKIIFWF